MCFPKMKREEKKKGGMGSRKREATQKEGISKRTVKENSGMTEDRESTQNMLEEDTGLQEKYLQEDKTDGILCVLTY